MCSALPAEQRRPLPRIWIRVLHICGSDGEVKGYIQRIFGMCIRLIEKNATLVPSSSKCTRFHVIESKCWIFVKYASTVLSVFLPISCFLYRITGLQITKAVDGLIQERLNRKILPVSREAISQYKRTKNFLTLPPTTSETLVAPLDWRTVERTRNHAKEKCNTSNREGRTKQ